MRFDREALGKSPNSVFTPMQKPRVKKYPQKKNLKTITLKNGMTESKR